MGFKVSGEDQGRSLPPAGEGGIGASAGAGKDGAGADIQANAPVDSYVGQGGASASAPAGGQGPASHPLLSRNGAQAGHPGGHSPSRLAEGWLPLSDVVAYLETLKTHRLTDRYPDVEQGGIDPDAVYGVIRGSFDVKPVQLEHDIGHQNPNPNRSITELASNAVDAMLGLSGDVRMAIEDGRYQVEDSGVGMGRREVFERLLIPQLSGKSGSETIGRFGIGFYTALAHLREMDSRVVVETKREGEPGIRVEFARLNGELGIRVSRSSRSEPGTRIEVKDARISAVDMQRELRDNMGYLLSRRIMVDGKGQVNAPDISSVTRVGSGAMYLSSERSEKGKLVITIGGVKIEEFVSAGRSVPRLMVLDLPLSTRLPESRNQVRVDKTVVEQVKAFIDIAKDSGSTDEGIGLLNSLAPMLRALQRRNEQSDLASDLMEYARSAMRELVGGRRVIPDDRFYDVVKGDEVRVNDLYLNNAWHSGFVQPPQWDGRDRVLLVDLGENSANGIMHDKERGIVLLDRALFEAHSAEPAGLEVLTGIPPEEISGGWRWRTNASTPRVQPDAETERAVSRVVKAHPVLIGQRDGLRALAASHSEAMGIIERLNNVFVPLPEIEAERFDQVQVSDVIGSGSDALFMKMPGRSFTFRFLRADGTPAVIGEHKARGGRNPQGNNFLYLVEGKNLELLTPDGIRAVAGSFNRISMVGTDDHPVIMLTDSNGRQRLLKPDWTPLVDGAFDKAAGLTVGGARGPTTAFWLQSQGENGRLIDAGGATIFESPFPGTLPLGMFFLLSDASGPRMLVNREGRVLYEGNDISKIGQVGSDAEIVYLVKKDGSEQHFTHAGAVNLDFKNISTAALVGDGDDQVIPFKEKDGGHKIVRRDGTPVMDGTFAWTSASGDGKGRIYTFMGDDGVSRVYDYELKPLCSFKLGEVDVVKSGEGKDAALLVTNNDHRIAMVLHMDGTPIFEGWIRHVMPIGKAGEGIFKVGRDPQHTWEVYRADGSRLIGPKHSIEPHGDGVNRIYAVVNMDGTRDLLNSEGRPLTHSRLRRAVVRGTGAAPILFVNEDVVSPFQIARLTDPQARRNIEKMLGLDLNTDIQGRALSLLSLGDEMFDFAMKLLPHARRDMSRGAGMLRVLMELNKTKDYSPAVLAALCDIGIAIGWGDNPPEAAVSKMRLVADKLNAMELKELRDSITSLQDARLLVARREYDKLSQVPPKPRGYLFYLVMDGAELMSENSSSLPLVRDADEFSLRDLNIAIRSNRNAWHGFSGNSMDALDLIQRQSGSADEEIAASQLRHAMYHLGDGRNLLFMRELIQNSLDAVRRGGMQGARVDIASFEEDGMHVLRIADPVGMDLSEVINNLLVTGQSSKGEGDLGKFGIGFFTIYPGAREIRIKTGKGDGNVSIFNLRPVYDGDRVVDVVVSFETGSDSFKGTVIERYSNGTLPQLDAAIAKSSVMTYGRFVDKNEVGVFYNGREVNRQLRPVANRDIEGIGRVRIYEGGENAFTVGGLYVKDLPSGFFDRLPAALRGMLQIGGIVVDLPGSTPLVRSRNDFVDPGSLERRLGPEIDAMIFEDFIHRFGRGEINVSGIPDEYFHSLYGFAQDDRIGMDIRMDALSLRNGGGLKDIRRYMDERGFLQLLSLLPCLNVGSGDEVELVSMNELLRRYERGDVFNRSKLPDLISRRLESADISKNQQKKNQSVMDEVARDLGITTRGREMGHSDWREDALHRHWLRADAQHARANAYDAFLSTIDRIMRLAGSSGHVLGLSSFLERNALADHTVRNGKIEIYFSLNAAERSALQLFEMLKEDAYPGEQMHSLVVDLLDNVTHEMTHDLLEGYGEWTHDPEFYRRQQTLVTRLMRLGPLDLEGLWRDLKAQYPEPTFMDMKQYLMLLVRGDIDGPEVDYDAMRMRGRRQRTQSATFDREARPAQEGRSQFSYAAASTVSDAAGLYDPSMNELGLQTTYNAQFEQSPVEPGAQALASASAAFMCTPLIR